ncbi:Rossmann-fold NAD(P)-binding domain-containing protein [Rhodobacter maris]|uniref:Uncharacterized protein n=1 Tax=Rhodobacter maris TaxID=446682 RepID=A0A285RKX1_9RHOB|nr:hypothetical protein [Rhodobacter maris]SOB94730.1 hypothetical protein SAMN05877831_101599 [Rhodobacter maris]
MTLLCVDLPEAWVAPLKSALALADLTADTSGTGPADFLILGSTGAGAAAAHLAAFAEQAPGAVPEGRDLRARAQAIWLWPEVTPLEGALRQAALRHAPALRVNAIALCPPRPHPEPWQAAWAPAQRPGPALPPAEALTLALVFLRDSPAVTGQILHLQSPIR